MKKTPKTQTVCVVLYMLYSEDQNIKCQASAVPRIHISQECWNPDLKDHNPAGFSVLPGRKAAFVRTDGNCYPPGWIATCVSASLILAEKGQPFMNVLTKIQVQM